MRPHLADPRATLFPHLAWCPEEDTRHHVRARRNVLAGLWAGRLLGLSGAELTAYAVAVHAADFAEPGDVDVVGKIAADLGRAGVPVCRSEMRARLSAFRREALRQTHATD